MIQRNHKMALTRCFSIVLQSEKLHFTLRQSESLPVVTAVSDSRGGILRVGHLLTAVAGTSLLEEDDGDKYHCALRLIKEASRPCTLCFVEEVQPIGGPDGHEDQQAWRKQSNETEKDLAEDGGEASPAVAACLARIDARVAAAAQEARATAMAAESV